MNKFLLALVKVCINPVEQSPSLQHEICRNEYLANEGNPRFTCALACVNPFIERGEMRPGMFKVDDRLGEQRTSH